MVSKTPIAFVDLPRQTGDAPVDTVTATSRAATAIDADNAKINTWATAINDRITVTRLVGSAFMTFEPNWTWYSTAEQGINGFIVGDVRHFSVLAKYTGPTVTADNYGGISPDQRICVIKDTRFRCTEQLWFTGSTAVGTGVFALNPDGVLYLCGLSYKASTLRANGYALILASYIPRG